MKVKLDENLPVALVETITALGHDVDTVPMEGLTGHPDDAVWSAAQAEGRLIVTQDLDFADVRRFAPGTHAGILLVRLRTPSRSALVERVTALFSSTLIGNWAGCFVVATETKVRVLSPNGRD
jgi:predicted nuclease of predicted toxin-antitoxin system